MTRVNEDGDRQILASEKPKITILYLSLQLTEDLGAQNTVEREPGDALAGPGGEDSTAESTSSLPMLELERGQGCSLLNFRGLSPF